MKRLFTICIVATMSFSLLQASEYSFRKYTHVKEFYSCISADTIQISKEYNLPAAAVLAIAGLESGYGRGYVSQITGNILSLGAFKDDRELPRLFLPYSKSSKKVLFDSRKIRLHHKKDLVWKKRPRSFKKDYRPLPYAGTTKNLEVLIYNDKFMKTARKECLSDFATKWIILKSNIKVFSSTRAWLDELIKKNGKDILFDLKVNQEFISRIGGHPNSFNYRKTWPKKVKLIMKKVGLVNLSQDMYYKKMNFNEAWSIK